MEDLAVTVMAMCRWPSIGTSFGFYGTFRSILRDAYIHETPDPNPGGAGCLFALNWRASDNLDQSNVMWYGKILGTSKKSTGAS
jgi:hypothetical protein